MNDNVIETLIENADLLYSMTECNLSHDEFIWLTKESWQRSKFKKMVSVKPMLGPTALVNYVKHSNGRMTIESKEVVAKTSMFATRIFDKVDFDSVKEAYANALASEIDNEIFPNLPRGNSEILAKDLSDALAFGGPYMFEFVIDEAKINEDILPWQIHILEPIPASQIVAHSIISVSIVYQNLELRRNTFEANTNGSVDGLADKIEDHRYGNLLTRETKHDEIECDGYNKYGYCPNCSRRVKVEEWGCYCDSGPSFGSEDGWCGGLFEYYCSICSAMILRRDNRWWYGETNPPDRARDYNRKEKRQNESKRMPPSY